MEIYKNSKELFNKHKAYTSVIGGGIGIVTDILQPLGPFAEYLFFSGLVLMAIMGVSYFVIINLREKVLPIFLYIVIGTFSTGVMYGLQSGDEGKNGFLASAIPGIEKLQSMLGIMQKDIDEIKKTTKDIKKDTTQIKNSVASVDSKMDKVIETIGKQDGIITSPKAPKDFYHNARLYELNGDYSNARRTYVKYFSFGVQKLDPHFRFQKFLKIQEGRSGAKEIYFDMFGESQEPINKYVRILLESGVKKRNMLESFMNKYPNFAPGYYELARQYSEALLGTQSLSDKKLEKDYIDIFLKLNKEDKLFKWFIDKGEMSKQIQYAQERKVALDLIEEDVFKNPIKVARTYSNSAWLLNLSIADKASEIFYRRDGKGEFKSTGYLDYRDSQTGKKMPRNTIKISHTSGDVEYIEFKYTDQRDNLNGPYKYEWAVKKEEGKNNITPKQQSDIKLLKRTEANWLSIRDFNNKKLLYFSHIKSFKDGVEKIMYGLNVNKPDKEYIGTDTYIQVPDDTIKVSVEIYFVDDTHSGIKIFNFK